MGAGPRWPPGEGLTIIDPVTARRPHRLFTAIVGQERMKLALLLAAVDPGLGGVLIRGERGTAKSTLVRALAGVLPEREVVLDCPYHCQPATGAVCDRCRERLAAGAPLPLGRRPTDVVELPLGASEDRVVGSIDLEEALRSGAVAFQPGVLAEANGQVLYVDEVNLLEHHLVDVLLDAAASGQNVVEREGVSAVHPARFLLVGTMNPDEGELRPQLLDRFGLCVDVAGLRDEAARVRIMELDERAELPSPAAIADEERLRSSLNRARELLAGIEVPSAIVVAAVRLALDQQVVGHRADLVLVRAARALRALRVAQGEDGGRVSVADLMEVAELALAHRRRVPGGWVPTASVPGDSADVSGAGGNEEAQPGDQGEERGEEGPEGASGAPAEARAESGEAQGTASGRAAPGPAAEETPVAEEYEATMHHFPRERRRRHGAGRRSRTTSDDRRGRYVSARWQEHTTDLALDATLRAAAPHQRERLQRRSGGDRAIHLERQDLRQKVRQRRIGNLIVFLVDASASMDAEQRMDATRSAILALLRDAYVRRDRVAMITFAGRGARVVLRPTASVDLAERQLARLAVGGTTPLTHGLVAATDLILQERRRDQEVLPLLVLISDGRGNISLHGDEPLREAQAAAAEVRRGRIRAVVIDTARDHPVGPVPEGAQFAGYNFQACVDLARRMAADYFGLFDVSEQGILRPVAEALRRTG